MGTFWEPAGTILTHTTPLTPFRRGMPWSVSDMVQGSSSSDVGPDSQAPFYTSLDVTSTKVFGYTYPDLEDDPSPTGLWSMVSASAARLWRMTQWLLQTWLSGGTCPGLLLAWLQQSP